MIFKAKIEEEKKTSKKKPTISFNRRLSVTVKLIIIKYVEERSIHATSNY